MKATPHWAAIDEVGFVAGMRLMFWICRMFGRWPFRLALYPVLAWYVLTQPRARRASCDYLARVGMRGGGPDGRWEYRVLLNVCRQGSGKFGAGLGQDFADLGESDLGLAFTNHLAAAAQPDLGFELFGNSKTLQQPLQIGAAQPAVAIGNSLRVEQCLLEGLRRGEVRLRRALANRDTHARTGDVGARACRKQAALGGVVGGLDADKGDVERSAFLDHGLQWAGRAVFGLELVAGRLLESRPELLNHRF